MAEDFISRPKTRPRTWDPRRRTRTWVWGWRRGQGHSSLSSRHLKYEDNFEDTSLAKFQRFSARGTFPNSGLNEGGRKNVHFQTKSGHILETVRDTAKITINH